METAPPPTQLLKLKEIKIENADTDGSTGGHEPFLITSNFQDYLNKPIYWKLNNLNQGQNEATRVVRVTFFDGVQTLSSTSVITLQRPEKITVQSAVGPQLNELDNSPPLITSDSLGSRSLLEESAQVIGYSVQISESEDEINLEFTPREFSEQEARTKLQNESKYYLRILMWLLMDSYSLPSHPIDPWYAFCDHLSEEILALIGAEPTTLANGQDLKCSDPPPTSDQFSPIDSHVRFTYKKIPATVLEGMITTAKLERENKELAENAKDIAFLFVPILGPTINAIRHPGTDPNEVAQATVVDALLQPVGGKATQFGGKILLSLGSKIKARFTIPNFRNAPASTYGNFAEEVGKAQGKLKSLKSLIVKLVSHKVILRPNLRRVVLYHAGRKWTEQEYKQVLFDIRTIYQKLPQDVRQHLLPVEQVERVLAKAYRKGNVRVLPDEEYDALIGALSPYKTGGIFIPHVSAQETMIVIRAGSSGNSYTHEVIHLIQELHRSSGYEDETLRMLHEGLTDWILHNELRLLPAFDQEVAQIRAMIIALEAQGVDGTGLARIAALRGDPRYLLQWFESTVGNFEPRIFFANQYAKRSAQGLILAPAFLRNPDTESDGDEIQIDVPQIPNESEEGSLKSVSQIHPSAPTAEPTSTPITETNRRNGLIDYAVSLWKAILGIK